MSESRKIRNEQYKKAIAIMNERNCRLGDAMKIVKGTYFEQIWDDDDSPTGRTQFCDYYGTCEYPCNGDC